MAGVQSIIDSVNIYLESLNYPANTAVSASAALLSATATATNTNNSADITNTFHKGGMLFVALTSVAATTTIGLNLQAKDPASGLYMTIARVSIDAVVTNATGQYTWELYPGIQSSVSLSGVGVNTFNTNLALPRVMRVQASITATASQGGAGLSYTVGLSKIL